MTQPTQSTLQCSNCGTPNAVTVRRVIDAQQDPQGKALLLNGQVNSFVCQNCGMNNSISSPLLYHDAEKELLIAFVPMDVAAKTGTSQNEEQIVGSLMNELTGQLPKEQFKAYMFNPKRALTLQGLIEQVLEADGITQEMIAEQKQRVALVQKFVEAQSEEAVIELAKDHDDQLDEGFFQTLSMMAQRLMQQGQQQVAGHMLAIQQVLVEHTSYGAELLQTQERQQELINEIADRIETLGDEASRDDFIDLAVEFADDEQKLEALAGLIRPALTDEFFSQFNQRISQAPADERETLESARDTLRELTEMIDQQTRSMVQQKAQFLRMLMTSPDAEAMMRQNVEMIDDNFMTVLSMNIQEAQKRSDVQTSAKLQEIYEVAVSLLREQMTPELRFINELLSFEDDAQVKAHIDANIDHYDSDLLQVVSAVEQMLAQQGRNDIIDKMAFIRVALEQALN